MRRRSRQWYVTLINAFWTVVWSPGLVAYVRSGDSLRPEDIVNPVALVVGIVLEWLAPRVALYVNCGYYLGYFGWLLKLSLSRSNDAHQAMALVAIGVPYVFSAAAIVRLHRGLSSSR
jgi:hypothetical protein